MHENYSEGTENYIFAASTSTGFIGIELNREKLEQLGAYVHESIGHNHATEIGRAVNHWIDSPQYHGSYHRVFHGHSLSDVIACSKEHGIQGVWEWSKHQGLDSLSPRGLPLPYAAG